ncbi:potassium channel family protein [Muricoccus aerilatus]|uniref:potassium channel family protein n=1 Tax=Muricoccus aerilatus TaxID=452982 RepID=UPI0009FC1014|nr:potassium channel family protein [Roseomonas aerilata]
MSGVAFFTLGYGDVVPHTAAARVVSVVEAGTWIGFIVVVIGYLPVLYQLFARREAHVIQLDGRAGSPRQRAPCFAATSQAVVWTNSTSCFASGRSRLPNYWKATSPIPCSSITAHSTTTSRGSRPPPR